MKGLWSAEPTLVLAFASAVIGLAVAYGLPVDAKQQAAIQAVIIAFFALINRAQVTSPASLQTMAPQKLQEAQQTSEAAKDIVQKMP